MIVFVNQKKKQTNNSLKLQQIKKLYPYKKKNKDFKFISL